LDKRYARASLYEQLRDEKGEELKFWYQISGVSELAQWDKRDASRASVVLNPGVSPLLGVAGRSSMTQKSLRKKAGKEKKNSQRSSSEFEIVDTGEGEDGGFGGEKEEKEVEEKEEEKEEEEEEEGMEPKEEYQLSPPPQLKTKLALLPSPTRNPGHSPVLALSIAGVGGFFVSFLPVMFWGGDFSSRAAYASVIASTRCRGSEVGKTKTGAWRSSAGGSGSASDYPPPLATLLATKVIKHRIDWSEEEERTLLDAYKKLGPGGWAQILTLLPESRQSGGISKWKRMIYTGHKEAITLRNMWAKKMQQKE